MAESSLSRSNIRRVSPLGKEGGSMSGSNIPTAGGRAAYDTARNTLERGLLEARRRQVMGGASAAPAAVSGTNAQGVPNALARPEPTLSPTQSRMKFYADQKNARVQQTAGASNEVLGGTDSRGQTFNPTPGQYEMGGRPSTASASTIPPLLARRPQPAPARQGMIDGKPAGEALAGMRNQALEGGPAQTYGADEAKRNIAAMGVNDAVADYFQRNRLDAERPQRAAEARAAASEAGSMFERSRPEMAGPPATGVVGPAQRALLDSRARRVEQSVQGPPVSAMTVGQAGPPAPLSQAGPPVSAMTVSQAGPPILARPRPEAQPPALVRQTNEFAQSLRDRANTPYQQRMTEGGITIDDMKKSLGGVAKTVAAIPAKARAFSDRTNQAAENFRRRYAP